MTTPRHANSCKTTAIQFEFQDVPSVPPPPGPICSTGLGEPPLPQNPMKESAVLQICVDNSAYPWDTGRVYFTGHIQYQSDETPIPNVECFIAIDGGQGMVLGKSDQNGNIIFLDPEGNPWRPFSVPGPNTTVVYNAVGFFFGN